MARVSKLVYEEPLAFWLQTITATVLLCFPARADLVTGPLPDANAEGFMFFTSYEPDAMEYLLIECDLANKTERAVARGISRVGDATVSLDGKRFFFAGSHENEDEFEIYIMERVSSEDDFKVASIIPLPAKSTFVNFVYDDWRKKLYVNYLVPVEGTL